MAFEVFKHTDSSRVGIFSIPQAFYKETTKFFLLSCPQKSTGFVLLDFNATPFKVFLGFKRGQHSNDRVASMFFAADSKQELVKLKDFLRFKFNNKAFTITRVVLQFRMITTQEDQKVLQKFQQANTGSSRR